MGYRGWSLRLAGHVNADAKHKLIRRYEVTDAAVHDSQKLDGLLNKGNTSRDVFADSAYRSAEIEAMRGCAATASCSAVIITGIS